MGAQKILDLAAGLFARDLNLILMSCFYQIVGGRTFLAPFWVPVLAVLCWQPVLSTALSRLSPEITSLLNSPIESLSCHGGMCAADLKGRRIEITAPRVDARAWPSKNSKT